MADAPEPGTTRALGSQSAHPATWGVKPLEWHKKPRCNDDWYADTVVGRYEAGHLYSTRVTILRRVKNGQLSDDILCRSKDIEATKAAAQQDYEARIMSSLAAAEAAPSPKQEG